MLLLERNHVAGTHRSMLVPAAFAHPYATLHGVREAAFVIRIFEIRLPLRRIVTFAVA